MFNKKMNQRIDLLIERIDSLSAKVSEIDAKLVSVQANISGLTPKIDDIDILVRNCRADTMVASLDTNNLLDDMDLLFKKLHEAKVIDAPEKVWDDDDDDDCPLENAELKKHDSEKDKNLLSSKTEPIGIEGGEFVIGKPKSEAKEIDGELIKEVSFQSKKRVVVTAKDREFFRMPFYRKLPQRFHLNSALGIGINMGLSRYNVEKLLSDHTGVMYYEEKSPKIFVLIKQLPQD